MALSKQTLIEAMYEISREQNKALLNLKSFEEKSKDWYKGFRDSNDITVRMLRRMIAKAE